MNEWLKTFETFLDTADTRMKAMRDEIRRELRDELRDMAAPGPQGEKGAEGADGKDGAQGPRGEAGARGERGEPGRDGANGKDGIGIADLRMVDCHLHARMTDGTEKNVGRVMGEMGPRGEKGSPGERGRDGEPGMRGDKGMDGKDGTPGRDGRDGTKGDPGRDGKDGVGPRELREVAATMLSELEVDGRTWKLGPHTITMPVPIYRGVWADDQEYEPGDMVTIGGSLWHTGAKTKDKPGAGETSWTLVVKKGRDGKDMTR